MDLPVAERVAKAFEAKYPGIAVRVERTGAERVFQRIGQEIRSKIHAVDVVNTSDAAHFIVWKRNGWLAPYVPEDVAKHFPTRPTAIPTGFMRRRASCVVVDRLQHQPGEAGGRAEELHGPARSEMDRARWSRRIRPTAAPS